MNFKKIKHTITCPGGACSCPYVDLSKDDFDYRFMPISKKHAYNLKEDYVTSPSMLLTEKTEESVIECANTLKQNVPEHVNEAAYVKCCNELAKSVISLLQVPPMLTALDEYKRTVGKEMALMQLELLTEKMKSDTLEREKKTLVDELARMTSHRNELNTKIDRALFSLA